MVAKTVALPNIRRLFKPDPGYLIGEFDLKQADARVVGWEADDDELKAIFKDRTLDLHTENAKAIWGYCNPILRQRAKAGVHAVNYAVKAVTLARTLGITVAEAEKFIDRWFDAHPGIVDWHARTLDLLQTTRTITNAFGYQRQYFDRPDGLLSQALAWTPQSTVAIVIAEALNRLDEAWLQGDTDVELLMQVHDSIICQWPKASTTKALQTIRSCMEVPVPYPDPLVMPVDAAISEVSWGDVEEVEWPIAV